MTCIAVTFRPGTIWFELESRSDQHGHESPHAGSSFKLTVTADWSQGQTSPEHGHESPHAGSSFKLMVTADSGGQTPKRDGGLL